MFNLCNFTFMLISWAILIWEIILSANVIKCAKYELGIKSNAEDSEESFEEIPKAKKKKRLRHRKQSKFDDFESSKISNQTLKTQDRQSQESGFEAFEDEEIDIEARPQIKKQSRS